MAFKAACDASYLEVDEGAAAVAAAALLAAAVDSDVTDLPEEAGELVPSIVADAELRARALAALERVLGPASELATLWVDDPGFRRVIEKLQERLSRVPRATVT